MGCRDLLKENKLNKDMREYVGTRIKMLNDIDQCEDAWDKCVEEIYMCIRGSHMASLNQLVKNGPVEDGDVISKSLRDDLIEWGLAVHVMHCGEFGYTAATYFGGFVALQAKKVAG